MTLKPAEPSREVEINGGALAGSFEVAQADENDSAEEGMFLHIVWQFLLYSFWCNQLLAKFNINLEQNDASPPAESETEVEEEKSEPEPEPEGGSAMIAFCTVLSVILL